MEKKCLTLFSVFLLCLFSCTKSVKLSRSLKCWPKEEVKRKAFEVTASFSTRSVKNQEIQLWTSYDPSTITFDPRRQTAVVIHGFLNNPREKKFKLLRNQLLLQKNRNVILVGWEKAVADIFAYHESVVHTEYVASRIRLLFQRLIQYWDIAHNVKPKDWAPVHLIGFSLGAHVAGQIGRLLKKKDKFTIQRITALDPAEPCFEDQGMNLRLTKTDAAFVDVIHTDGAMKKNHGLGLMESIGHVDFYVNGGFNQPNCATNLKPKFKSYINYMQILIHAVKNGLCQHNRALAIFTETIRQAMQKKCKFYAVPWRLNSTPKETKAAQKINCNSSICPEMGINADLFPNYKRVNNSFYVSTSGERPFCMLTVT